METNSCRTAIYLRLSRDDGIATTPNVNTVIPYLKVLFILKTLHGLGYRIRKKYKTGRSGINYRR